MKTFNIAALAGDGIFGSFLGPWSAGSGLLFFNTLFDENASCHLALGRAYKFNYIGGLELTDEEFSAVGGNLSLIHVDFMVGSDKMDIDGITDDGRAEPVMRKGEWAFDV